MHKIEIYFGGVIKFVVSFMAFERRGVDALTKSNSLPSDQRMKP